MTDKELLELAAKAAGIEWHKGYLAYLDDGDRWSPLVRDDHALRLAVKLGVQMYIFSPEIDDGICVPYTEINREFREYHKDDPYAATRRAIVRASAEIGRGM